MPVATTSVAKTRCPGSPFPTRDRMMVLFARCDRCFMLAISIYENNGGDMKANGVPVLSYSTLTTDDCDETKEMFKLKNRNRH